MCKARLQAGFAFFLALEVWDKMLRNGFVRVNYCDWQPVHPTCSAALFRGPASLSSISMFNVLFSALQIVTVRLLTCLVFGYQIDHGHSVV